MSLLAEKLSKAKEDIDFMSTKKGNETDEDSDCQRSKISKVHYCKGMSKLQNRR